MIERRRAIVVLVAAAAAMALQAEALAQSMRVVDTGPADGATIDPHSEGFYVRFNKPVDHVRSILEIKRGDQVIQTLHPRLKAAPDVLFARVPPLEPGDYTLSWTVNALDGKEAEQGQISFSVSDKRATH